MRQPREAVVGGSCSILGLAGWFCCLPSKANKLKKKKKSQQGVLGVPSSVASWSLGILPALLFNYRQIPSSALAISKAPLQDE